jgi:hypothetical protein
MPMQKVIFGLGVAWLLVVSGNISLLYGQAAAPMGSVKESTQLGRDLFLTIGLDIWPHQWQTGIVGNTGANIQSSADFGVGIIPTLTLTYKRFFISASYLVTPEFGFGTTAEFDPRRFAGLPNIFVVQETNLRASRQEGDFTAGYFPLDWLGFAIGWKGVFQDYETQTRLRTIDDQVSAFTLWNKTESSTNYNGPIAGVLGSARINDSFSLVGNVFGGYLFTSCSPQCSSFDDAAYISSKIVLRYALKDLPQLFWTIGYRVQVLNTFVDSGIDTGSGTMNAIDLTHGPVFGMNYRF